MENIETNINKQESDTKMLDTCGFNELNLNEDVIKGVYLYGFTKPSNIQIHRIQFLNRHLKHIAT